ncbi:hypothetical protein PR202_gb26010 [Eleusine coracana subsp. coracana]|uniref:Uncharacterized protein n=1 Tax=Eleusine coracana subsp. coracana TaxID=191504 RepID=A0AAV5FQS0_ELECO|nr:hypothetical protein PR202_gb26010 [Eleusine coracana subsp. coracana]
MAPLVSTPPGAAPPPSPTPESAPATSQTVASAAVSLSPTAPVSTPFLRTWVDESSIAVGSSAADPETSLWTFVGNASIVSPEVTVPQPVALDLGASSARRSAIAPTTVLTVEVAPPVRGSSRWFLISVLRCGGASLCPLRFQTFNKRELVTVLTRTLDAIDPVIAPDDSSSLPRVGEGNGEAASSEPVALNDGASPARAPPCIIDWSDHLERAQADLWRAVFVTVYGDHPNISIEDLKQTIASRFDLFVDTLVLHRAGIDLYILFVDDEATAVRLESAGPPQGSGVVRIHCHRWTRQAIASGAALPSLVDVELCGIPAHAWAWEMSTAESQLNPFGWPQRLDHATRNREDYSVFRVSAWCFKPEEVPRSRDLHIFRGRRGSQPCTTRGSQPCTTPSTSRW